MNFSLKSAWLYRASIVCSLLGLAGCNAAANRPDADIFGNGLRDMVRGIAAGRAYDRAMLAQGRGDSNGATENYRRALMFAPNFGSENPDLLNAAGYMLADRGQTIEDFQNAEKLTRSALALVEKMIAKVQEGPEDEPMKQARLRALRYALACGPRDSLAWSLFKLKRYDEALKEQQRAVADAKANEPAGLLRAADSMPDLLYHLGAIYAALGQKDKAKSAFDEALKLKPTHTETKAAQAKLN